ncbi:translationally-controlled tumor protein homolog [Gossypium raimondii]|uniref:translationally-controlled tumor protein homolog n=1 Tax=Gossypium raimondii TaxID=29730 RepID=UPI00227AF51E|nr:translationally-controlled tumor protein homolog [Gossypium raimondii]
MLVYQNLLTGNREWDAKVGHATNPSAQGGDDQAVKVVHIVYPFRLEATPSDKKQFVVFMNKLIKNLTSELDAKKKETFKKNNEGATKFLLFKLKDFQFLSETTGDQREFVVK